MVIDPFGALDKRRKFLSLGIEISIRLYPLHPPGLEIPVFLLWRRLLCFENSIQLARIMFFVNLTEFLQVMKTARTFRFIFFHFLIAHSNRDISGYMVYKSAFVRSGFDKECMVKSAVWIVEVRAGHLVSDKEDLVRLHDIDAVIFGSNQELKISCPAN